MDVIRARIGNGGRIVIPARYRHEMGLEVGDAVTMLLDDGELRITTRRAAIKRAQKLLRAYLPEGVSLVDELIAERAREAIVD